MFEYLVKQAILNETTESFNKLTDADLNYATNLLSTKFFNELLSTRSIHLDGYLIILRRHYLNQKQNKDIKTISTEQIVYL